MTGSQIAALVIAGMGASFLIGLGVGESHSDRREKALRDEGLKPVAHAPAPIIKNCNKQAVREYINACTAQARMEKVK